jgi:hypothetical protein
MGLYKSGMASPSGEPDLHDPERAFVTRKRISVPTTSPYERLSPLIDIGRRILVESIEMTCDTDKLASISFLIFDRDLSSSKYKSSIDATTDVYSPHSSARTISLSVPGSSDPGEKGYAKIDIPFILEADKKLIGYLQSNHAIVFIKGVYLD